MDGLDNSDEIQSKHDNEHTILITDGSESPLSATSPMLADGDISDQNEGEHAPNTSGSSQELPRDDPDAHQADDAGPHPDDEVETRGMPKQLVVSGDPLRVAPSNPSNPSEGTHRGPNLRIAQGRAPSAGPSPIGGSHLLPRTGTPPPPGTPTND
ncbi:hypothetical protein FRC08_004563 [Ceratobasidium sp. 394]|nr:hypothetical protein FRC08_004563 [Ceratobasidium sp. 394]KAG9092501.1 hypothetical protein FS749_015675 [Ceratobasidium sp. UAMH 11750]